MDEFNLEKYKQVLHYIISKTDSSTHLNVGKKVLYKLLYFNDFNYYELTEQKMTGETYTKLEHGPAPSHFQDAINILKSEGLISETETKYHEYKQTRYHSQKVPALYLLNAEELEQINDTLNRYSSMNDLQIEALSHKDTPWIIAKHTNDELDYEYVFYRTQEMSVREYPNDED